MPNVFEVYSFPEMKTYSNNKRLPDTIHVKLSKVDLYKVSKKNMIEPSQPAILSDKNQDALIDSQDVDLIVFDDDIASNRNSNNMINTSSQPMSLIDTLLCDPNFGAFPTPTQSEESPKLWTKDEIERISSYNSDHSYQDQSEDLIHTHENHETRVNKIDQPNSKIIKPVKHKPKVKSKRQVYSFAELIFYRHSPITKGIKCVFSQDAAKYNLLIKKAYIAPALRKFDEQTSFNLSFFNEFMEAQNRWVALMMGRSLIKKARDQLIDCKNFYDIISVHYHSKVEHEDECGSRLIVDISCCDKECDDFQDDSFGRPQKMARFRDNSW
ncbi:16162_t:CDS:2 [Acaulospora morrowiae]|uniref:16162_t:CDS:1 n=1 Tax=Acaulospora morrowiae TaxID=94023 RepID=A0A9N8ZKP9_9GLOM|nr:16162_t:CDS:2 [Acaulospora morrowiae]